MATTYTVKWGDTLWAISQRYNTTVNNLVKLNHISNPDYIVVGQVLKLDGDVSKPTAVTSKPEITAFGLESNTDRSVYAVWSWSKANTEKYKVLWEYNTGDGVWFDGNNSEVTVKESLYNAPNNATAVRFKVTAIVKTESSTKKYVSSTSTYYFKNNPPKPPSVPTVAVNGTELTATLNNIGNLNATMIQFNIAKGDNTSYKKIKVKISGTSSATLKCTVDVAGEYKVRCCSIRGYDSSIWSEWTNSYYTIPATPSEISQCTMGSDEKSIVLKWAAVATADSYDIQYTTTKSDFDAATSASDALKTLNNITTTSYTITGVESGKEYFVRVRAVNSKVTGDTKASEWTAHSSTAVGTLSAAPTTMSSVMTATVGDPVTLYWLHNSEDGSKPTYADLEMYVDGVKNILPTFDYTDDKGVTETNDWKSYVLDTSDYDDGAKVQWRVRTAGTTKQFGEWSVLRTVDIYAKPELELTVIDSAGSQYTSSTEGVNFVLESLPMSLSASAGPIRQSAISYHVEVVANESYETTDNVGNLDVVNEGEAVYSKHFDTFDESDPNMFALVLSAGELNLDAGISYSITCSVVMDSGLSAEASIPFSVSWVDVMYELDAEVTIDEDSYTASIHPYCRDADGNDIENVLLYVYRREFNGSFTELGSDIVNGSNTYIPDPHPALDYARYRVVAIDKMTGAVSYSDIPGVALNCKSAIIQWDEQWTDFNVTDESPEVPSWSGSLLKLPYNVDVSDDHTIDVELVEYIGREHPVSYYGTQVGATSNWSMAVPKADRETLYALRRLAKWMGDVYVREPSGSGYWANVKVSFNQKHLAVTIPVTMKITRVEGGA